MEDQTGLNDLSYRVRGAIFEVYNELGPGLMESVYESALDYELRKRGMDVERQVPVSVVYAEEKLPGIGFRMDILVEKKLIIEIKSVELINPVHYKQLLTYLKLTNCQLGLLVNFNSSPLFIKRMVNGF